MSGKHETGTGPFSAYVLVVVLAGLLTLAIAITATGVRGLVGDYPMGFVILAALLVLSEAKPMALLRPHDATDITISWTFAFALVLLAPAGGLLAMWVASSAGDALRRTSAKRIAFNAAQLTLSLAAAIAVLTLHHADHAIGALDLRGPSFVALLVMLVAAGTVFVVNIVLASSALALYENVAVVPLIRSGLRTNTSTDGMLLALAPLFALTAARFPLLVPLLVIAVSNVYRAANLALARQHDATHDALTDLPNRRAFFEEVRTAVSRTRRGGDRFAVALLDLDGFKEINDRLGHQAGDLVLREVAARLGRVCRSADVAARLGGDEFAVLLGDVADETVARAAVARFEEELQAPFTVDGVAVTITGSFGIAMPAPEDDVERLIHRADQAMYAMKSAARRPAPRRSIEASMLGELEQAIDRHELVLHYQPKVDLRSGAVLGMEALVRWVHPHRGLIMPDDFITAAEQTDLMEPLTAYVLREALEQCSRWLDDDLPLGIAVNVSARNVTDPNFPAVVKRLLSSRGVDASWLELELTENALLVGRDRAAEVLHSLHRTGVSLAIDDFGTGYSSLVNLRDLPFDRLKIDRCFVTDMDTFDSDGLIVAATIGLAEKLGITSIAEGVEDARALQRLTRLGCNLAQGYYIARPAPGDVATQWVKGRRIGAADAA